MILRLFRWAVACFFVLFFLVILHEPFRSMVPEVGLWGYATVLIHMANAFCLSWLCRSMRLSRRVSFLAGLTFLSLFIHFHAVVWLPGSQHVLTLFAILIALLLFSRFRYGGRLPRTLLWGGIGTVVLGLALRDSRQILLPYNTLGPFIAVLSSFLNPFAAALKIDSTVPYHTVTAGISTATLALTVFLLAVFSRAILRHKRRFLIFGVWYVAVLLAWLLHPHAASSMPFQEPSRYFMYVTPIFCVVFCPVVVILYMRLARRMRWRGLRREAILISLFVFFWVPNLLAIRVALLRGRLANTYDIYDDIRRIRANEISAEEGFTEKFHAGVQALNRRRTPAAAALLEEAAHQRPFLLNYLLTPQGRLSDLSWVIGKTDLEDWLTLLAERNRREHVRISIRSELDDYRSCLFYLAFLRWRDGRTDEALFWLSRLRFLERDVDRLTARLLEDPLLLSDPGAAPFLADLKGSLSRLDSLPWRKNDYAFGRWMVRILLGWDIRSRWDRQFPEAP